GGEIAAQRVIGRFGASVHAKHRAGTQCRRRNNENDSAVASLTHIRTDHARQPQITQDIIDHHSLKDLVGQLLKRTVMRIYRRVADEDVDPTPRLARLGDKIFELCLIRNPGSDSNRLAAWGADRLCDSPAWRGVTRGDDAPPPRLGKRLGDCPADPTAGTGNDRYLPGQIEKPHDAPPENHV